MARLVSDPRVMRSGSQPLALALLLSAMQWAPFLAAAQQPPQPAQRLHASSPVDASRLAPDLPGRGMLPATAPPFVPTRLAGKIAVAEFTAQAPGLIRGSVEFSLCEEETGVFVKVDLRDNETQCISGQGSESGPCLYQINTSPINLARVAAEGVAACGSPFDVFDPLMSGAKGWKPSYESEDICSSTQSSSFGQGSKLASCPVGGLSRKWGVLRSFFDDNLAAFNDIVGRSVVVFTADSSGIPRIKSCASIRFKENCQIEEKEQLMQFKDSLAGGSELLASWQPWNDMCGGFFGVRCEALGQVVELELDNATDMRVSALDFVKSINLYQQPSISNAYNPVFAAANISSNGTSPVSSIVTAQQLHNLESKFDITLNGTLPTFFSSLSGLKQLRLAGHRIFGRLPKAWSVLLGIRELDLHGNFITGTLPSSWGRWADLVSIDLSNNQLEGPLPPEWSSMQLLDTMDLSQNHLTGKIPSILEPMNELVDVNISFNDGLCDPYLVLNSSGIYSSDSCSFPRSRSANASPTFNNSGTIEDSPFPTKASKNPAALLIVVIAVSVFVVAVVVLLALIWSYSKCFRSRITTKDSEVAETNDSEVSGSDDNDKGGSPNHFTAEMVVMDTAFNNTGVGMHKCVDDLISPFERAAYMMAANDESTPVNAKTGSQGSNSGVRNSKGSLSPGSNASSRLHCTSGVHPLDFAGVDDIEGAIVDRNALLGSGGYGVVFKGLLHQNGKDLDVAVKVISNSDNDEIHMSKYKSFEDEVATLSLFQGNDCIVKVYDYILEYPRAVIFYEYLANDTLGRLVHKKLTSKLNYLEVLQMGYGIAEGLATLHARNVVHRDLKPDNILLDTHMRPRLTDFGISRQKNPDASSITTHNIGTWIYMAPEQFNGRLSEASDMYSLGMILWEIWCSERPWSCNGDEHQIWQVMYKLIHENERPEIPDSCPTDLAAIIRECWATEPKIRPTAVEVKNRLWKVIIEEMKNLNAGPQRLVSPDRKSRKPSTSSSNREMNSNEMPLSVKDNLDDKQHVSGQGVPSGVRMEETTSEGASNEARDSDKSDSHRNDTETASDGGKSGASGRASLTSSTISQGTDSNFRSRLSQDGTKRSSPPKGLDRRDSPSKIPPWR